MPHKSLIILPGSVGSETRVIISSTRTPSAIYLEIEDKRHIQVIAWDKPICCDSSADPSDGKACIANVNAGAYCFLLMQEKIEINLLNAVLRNQMFFWPIQLELSLFHC